MEAEIERKCGTMNIFVKIEDDKTLEKAIARAIGGVIGKKFSKTRQITKLLLIDALTIAVTQKVNPKVGELLEIDLDFDVDSGALTRFKNVSISVYSLGDSTILEEVGLTQDAIDKFIVIKELQDSSEGEK